MHETAMSAEVAQVATRAVSSVALRIVKLVVRTVMNGLEKGCDSRVHG